jgi:hypothetical protein
MSVQGIFSTSKPRDPSGPWWRFEESSADDELLVVGTTSSFCLLLSHLFVRIEHIRVQSKRIEA